MSKFEWFKKGWVFFVYGCFPFIIIQIKTGSGREIFTPCGVFVIFRIEF